MSDIKTPYLVKYRNGLSGDKIVFASDVNEAKNAGLAEFRYNTYGPDSLQLADVVASVVELPPTASVSNSRPTSQLRNA